MNVEEGYAKIGGSYSAAVHRFKTDERMIKYFKIIQKDPHLDVLRKALQQNDYETAFCAAHTLKGLALNMQFTVLAAEVSELTELLRLQKANANIMPLLSKTKQTYQTILCCIPTCLESAKRRSYGENER